ncbi:MAG: tetratricopeptide repeat protein [Candidatus Kapabacteria bacterium]|nr:tetratricopeptide repeat protein [Candidatus Kapabacteria bacterium]
MRNLIIFFVMFFVAVNISFAQLQGQAKIDSLKAELPKSKQDTNHVNLLADLSFLYNSINPDEGIKYGEQGLKLAEKIGWKEGIERCYSSLGDSFMDKSDYTIALGYYHKALKINEELGNEQNVAGFLNNIGLAYYYQSDYLKSLESFHKALKMFEELENKSGVSLIHGNIGMIYYSQSDYPKAIEYYHKALKIHEETENKRGIAGTLHNMGMIYSDQSDGYRALEYYLKALKINEEIDNKNWIAYNLEAIGVVYNSQSDYPKAIEYYHKALEINEELGNKYGIQSNHLNIGNIFMTQSDYPKALEFFHKAIEINEEIGRISGIALGLGQIGGLYLKISKDSNMVNSENNLQLMLNKEINLNKAIEYSQQAINLYQEIGELYYQLFILNNLSEAYELKGDYKKAFEAFKEFKTLQDSVFSMDKQKEIANLDAKRENELKDAEIIILNTEKKAQQFQSYLLGGGVIVLLGAFGIAFLRFREKKKLSDKLTIQNNEIENQKLLVEEKSEEIYASIRYASTIQNAILPWDATLGKAFSDVMVFFKPKDIVSGDSYWFKEVDGVKFLAVVDCTGHGIPGAMLTVIASTALDDAVLGKRLSDPAEILTYINEKVTDVLNQRLSENQTRDGMEVALLAIHQDKIKFSGAGRPLYLKNGTLEIIKTDKRGIAGSTKNDEYQFNSVEIEKSENITLYLTTDGFADQMNEDGKKFSTRRFLALLESIAENPLKEQYKRLNNELAAHQGEKHQIDDITIIGVRL